MKQSKDALFLFAVAVAFSSAFAEPLPYRHFDLGVGSYGSGFSWGGGTLLDIARYDWTLVSFPNDAPDLSTVRRLNEELTVNPKLKIMVRLWPKTKYKRVCDGEQAKLRYCGFMDYLYYPDAKAEFIRCCKRDLHLVLDNVAKPENVYGFTLFEELPHQFGADPNILERTAPGTPVDAYVIQFKDFYEKETGKQMTEWNRDVRIWWGKCWAKALRDVYVEMKKDAPKVRGFVWYMSHFRLLDWLDEGEDVHSPKVIPCHWKDIVEPGVAADGFFAYANNAFWAKRYQDLARKNRWPYFSQLSHTAGMRISSWDECLQIAKADIPENLGYFYYGPDFTYGHWNDDPDVDPEDVADLPGMYNRMRRFLAKENVGMDIVRRGLVPEVVFSHDLGTTPLKNFSMVTATVVNRRTTKWFLTPEEATLRNVKVHLELPDAFSLPPNVSEGADIVIPVMKPGELKKVVWWARRDKETPAGAKMPTTLEVSAVGVEPVKIATDDPVHTPVAQNTFGLKQSGDGFNYIDWGIDWGCQPTEFVLSVPHGITGGVKNPTLRCESRQITYNGTLKTYDKLVIGPGKKATLVRQKKETDVSDKLDGESLSVSKGVTAFRFFEDYPSDGSVKAWLKICVVPPPPKEK